MGPCMPLRSITGGLPPLAMASRRDMLPILMAKGANSLLTPGLRSGAWRLLLVTLVLRVTALLPVAVLVWPGIEVPRLETVSRVPGTPPGMGRASGFQYLVGRDGTHPWFFSANFCSTLVNLGGSGSRRV